MNPAEFFLRPHSPERWYAILWAVSIAVAFVTVMRFRSRSSGAPRKILSLVLLILGFLGLVILLFVLATIVLPALVKPRALAAEISYAETLLMTTLGIFVPILLTIWTNTLKDATEALTALKELAGGRGGHAQLFYFEHNLPFCYDDKAKKNFDGAKMEYSELLTMGNVLQPIFYTVLGITVVFVVMIQIAALHDLSALLSSMPTVSVPDALHFSVNILVVFYFVLLSAHVFIVLPGVARMHASVCEVHIGEINA